MASELQVEVEVKSTPDKFWGGIRDSDTLFPKLFPEMYKSIDIVEGDGKSVGSVRHIKYAEGTPLVTFAKEKIVAADEEKKTVAYTLIDGDLANFYKNFKATLQVLPKGDGALVKWGMEYDKVNEEVPEPDLVQLLAVKTFQDLDEHLLKA